MSIAETLYDLYDDDLNKTEDRLSFCSLCNEQKDITAHLFSCTNPVAVQVVQEAWKELQLLPPGQALSEMNPSAAADLKVKLAEIFKEDSFARIGLFSRGHQDQLIQMLGEDRIGKKVVREARAEIVNRVAIMAAATIDLIYLRNNCKFGVRGWADMLRERPPKKTKGRVVVAATTKKQLSIKHFFSRPNNKKPLVENPEIKPAITGNIMVRDREGLANASLSKVLRATQPAAATVTAAALTSTYRRVEDQPPHTMQTPISTRVVDPERRAEIDRIMLNHSDRVLSTVAEAPIAGRSRVTAVMRIKNLFDGTIH